MGLAIRVIPTVLSKHGNLVKGKAFASDRVVGNALQATRIYGARMVDEIVFLDVAATPEKRGPDFEMVERLTDRLFAPVTYGGGVRSVEDVRKLLQAGADKVCIGTGAIAVATLVHDAAQEFGSQAIVVSIDVRGGVAGRVRTLGAGPGPVGWARDIERIGAGEILLQSVDRDGTMDGYDLELIRSVAAAVDIPVIASGGCSGYEDMYRAIEAGASAVAAGALFQFTDCTPRGAAEYLKSKGVEVRI